MQLRPPLNTEGTVIIFAAVALYRRGSFHRQLYSYQFRVRQF
jgi:hypothetical protein